MAMLRCSSNGRHLAPADQFSLNDRGVMFSCCDTCRAEARRKAAIRGDVAIPDASTKRSGRSVLSVVRHRRSARVENNHSQRGAHGPLSSGPQFRPQRAAQGGAAMRS